MGSSDSSSLSANVARLIDGASKHRDGVSVDCLPVYVKELIAGGASGGFAKTAVAPLERIKILFQTRTEGFRSLGVCGSFKKLTKQEGVQGLYKGNGASILRIVPYAAVHYMSYERYRAWLRNNCDLVGTGPVVDLLAGSASGGTAVLCTYPLDLVRTKLAYQVADSRINLTSSMSHVPYSPSYNGIQDTFKKVYNEGGVRALYRGVGPTLVGILPYAGLKFYIYEELKSRVPEEHQKSCTLHFSCGALAGLFGQTLTYPLDVVRRQMQVENSQHGSARYKNTFDGLVGIMRNQGCRQLFAGLSINYLKVVPSVAIGFTMYDYMKSLLHISSEDRS